MGNNNTPNLNELVQPLVESLCDQSVLLGTVVSTMSCGARLIDAGIKSAGSIECGRRIAEICMGGLGRVDLSFNSGAKIWPWQLAVSCNLPVLSCLGSQYAGWSLSGVKSGTKQWFGNASGPARLIGSKEPMLAELGFSRQKSNAAVLVIESDSPPPEQVVLDVAAKCGLKASALTLIVTPTISIAGGVQIVARVLETALHKAHTVGFAMNDIVDGLGTAPLFPPGGDFVTAMGRSNDSILFAGQVQLYVRGSAAAAKKLAQQLPSSSSPDYGRQFAEIFKSVKYDFYRIDPLLFSPAQVAVTAIESGSTYYAGGVDEELLQRSFDGEYAFS
ncbi:MAG: methenyltetrahydromethanopterin cyclohydrolase [Candidatus Porifericomitaceae bacterium WSBS_2022_MAG_OTU9]